MEPDRSLSTSSEGLSAITEIEAPCFFNYGSRTLFWSRTWQGKFKVISKERGAQALTPQSLPQALLVQITIGEPIVFFKEKVQSKEKSFRYFSEILLIKSQ